MGYAQDLGFDESDVVAVKDAESDFEHQVGFDIFKSAVDTNHALVYDQNKAPVKFKSRPEMYQQYWKDYLAECQNSVTRIVR